MSVIGQEEGIVHGTLKGYKQHRYRKVDACEACLKAVRDDNARRAPTRKAARANKPAAKPVTSDHESSPFGVIHGDTAREIALTYLPFVDEADDDALAAERRERMKAALTCLLLDARPGDLIEALGIPDDEAALARQAADRLNWDKEAAR